MKRYLVWLLLFFSLTVKATTLMVQVQDKAEPGSPTSIVVRMYENCTSKGDDLSWEEGNAGSYSLFECQGVANLFWPGRRWTTSESNYFSTVSIEGNALKRTNHHCALIRLYYNKANDWEERHYDCRPPSIFENGFEP